MIGPFRGGRAVAVAGDGTTFYFGAVDGGIWKTTNAGVTWAPIFDGQAIASIGALAVAPSNPQVIYAGTGESDIRSNLSSGDGVYKSEDAGQTWRHIGLEETRQISRIVVDPRNSEVVYVGALGHAYGPNPERGLFKSVDGGLHWTKILDLGPETGVADVAICSSNSELLFATAWHSHRPPWSTYAPIDGPGSGLYRSQDGGKAWTRIEGKGLPESNWGRSGVDISNDGKRVYALISAKTGSGLYRSDDSGDNWTLQNHDERLTSRAWYFSGITIDPQDSNVLYMPNVALYRSEDGGKTISIVRGAPGGDDYHQIWVDPKNSTRMVLGTDQGTTISLDRGRTWSTWYNQPTSQIYHVTTDEKFPYTVYGAQQDSGSVAVVSRTDHGQITPRDWFPSGPSESGYLIVDPKDSNIIYLSSTYGGVERYNRRIGLTQNVSPWPVSSFGTDINERKYRAPWTPVLAPSPLERSTLFFGTQYVMKTVDGGLHWQTISGDLTGAAEQPKTDSSNKAGTPDLETAKELGYGIVATIAPSPIDRNVIWAGSDTGLVHLTRDGGKTWRNVTPPNLTAWSAISLIDASYFDPSAAYAAVSRSRLDDQKPYIYRTRDYGSSWQLVNEGIDNTAFVRAVRQDPKSKGLLFAGTELGVYVSFDDGDHWQSLQLNLPVCSVRDLAIHGDDLVIATHGRSFWILDDFTALRQARDAATAKGVWLFKPAVAVRIDNDSFFGTPLPPEEPTAENPPSGAIVDYVLDSPAKEVRFEILDAQHNLVRSFSSSEQKPPKAARVAIADRWLPKPEILRTTAGMHRFVWDLSWGSDGESTGEMEEESRGPTPPKVQPGKYQIKLTVDGKTMSQPLEITMDPRSAMTPELLQQQFELAHKVYLEALAANRTVASIRSIQKQLVDIESRLQNQQASVDAELKDIRKRLGAILKDGSETGLSRGLQPAAGDLASALRVIEGGDRAVPAQAIELYKQSSAEIQARTRDWDQLKTTSLRKFNEEIEKSGVGSLRFDSE